MDMKLLLIWLFIGIMFSVFIFVGDFFVCKLNENNKVKKWWRRHIVGVKES